MITFLEFIESDVDASEHKHKPSSVCGWVVMSEKKWIAEHNDHSLNIIRGCNDEWYLLSENTEDFINHIKEFLITKQPKELDCGKFELTESIPNYTLKTQDSFWYLVHNNL